MALLVVEVILSSLEEGSGLLNLDKNVLVFVIKVAFDFGVQSFLNSKELTFYLCSV